MNYGSYLPHEAEQKDIYHSHGRQLIKSWHDFSGIHKITKGTAQYFSSKQNPYGEFHC